MCQGYHYSLEAFKGLGQLYVDDEGFTQSIERFGDCLSKFMHNVMSVYADNNS
ncbi:hypothetical protein CJP46_26030 [Paenibacillus sp. XY044]|nr:hypothetical protein CJP46_26030 [Paenibacillus sp. XY044]